MNEDIKQQDKTNLLKKRMELLNETKEFTVCFESELTNLLNKYSKENESNTPDFLLAEYLSACLENYNRIIQKKEVWLGAY
jgi:hypothetical protein